MRATRLLAAAALVAALGVPATASAGGGCTLYWKPLLPPGSPAQVYVPYCVW